MQDAETAKEFLLMNPVTEDFHYIIVETPDGNWGIDVKELYKEFLEDWQFDTVSAECEGVAIGEPDEFSFKMASQGICDNFIVKVKCGNCNFEWTEGLRYRDWTMVKCPNCGKLNKIDSGNIS